MRPQNLCKKDGTEKDCVQSLLGAKSSLPWVQKAETRLERMMEEFWTQEHTPLSTQTGGHCLQRAHCPHLPWLFRSRIPD